MSAVRFDHLITFTSATTIDDYLNEYLTQGFMTHGQTVRHEPGLRNGFVSFGPDYLEFWWVENEVQFAAADADQRALRVGQRPFGIGMVAQDVQVLHHDWSARGYAIGPVTSRAPRDAPVDAPPAWSFQDIPHELLPGCLCFALTYHGRSPDDQIEVKVGSNTIYALSGVTFVAIEAEARSAQWRDLLAPGEPVIASEAGFTVRIGPHLATWMTPDSYHAAYGRVWKAAPHSYSDLALLQLLAADLDQMRTILEQAGRRLTPYSMRGQQAFLIEPDERDGVTFLVQQQPIAAWLHARMARTGEVLTMHDPTSTPPVPAGT
jgi:hypothetical protein